MNISFYFVFNNIDFLFILASWTPSPNIEESSRSIFLHHSNLAPFYIGSRFIQLINYYEPVRLYLHPDACSPFSARISGALIHKRDVLSRTVRIIPSFFFYPGAGRRPSALLSAFSKVHVSFSPVRSKSGRIKNRFGRVGNRTLANTYIEYRGAIYACLSFPTAPLPRRRLLN